MPSFVPLAADDVLFVADTHFRDRSNPAEAARRSRFLRFLESVPAGCALFLLGDIFDFYFEYRSVVSNRYFDLFCGLRRCTERGVRLHFIGGNHDHWAGRFLSEEVGVEIHTTEILFEAQGRRVVCSHGDLVMPRDWGYKILKTVIRNPLVVVASRWIHPDLLDAIAGAVSNGSRAVGGRSQEAGAQRLSDWAHERFFDRGNDIYVMGHVHHALRDERAGREFLIVGDWFRAATYARLYEGSITLETFTDPGPG